MSDKATKILMILCIILGPLMIGTQWIGNEQGELFIKILATIGGVSSFATGIYGLKILKDRENSR